MSESRGREGREEVRVEAVRPGVIPVPPEATARLLEMLRDRVDFSRIVSERAIPEKLRLDIQRVADLSRAVASVLSMSPFMVAVDLSSESAFVRSAMLQLKSAVIALSQIALRNYATSCQRALETLKALEEEESEERVEELRKELYKELEACEYLDEVEDVLPMLFSVILLERLGVIQLSLPTFARSNVINNMQGIAR